jgi:energy-coupling factor transporter ATP-binding protein EcfA2
MVIVLFFAYLAAANIYVQMTYGGRNTGPAVPNITKTITLIVQVAVIIVTALVAINATIKSRRLLGIIPFKDIQRHLLLLGPTGAGKTTIAKRLIGMAVRRRVRVTILDWKGEYVGYVHGATVVRKLNPWDVGGRNPAERAAVAVEMLREITRDIADVSSASATLLLKELAKLYTVKTPNTRDVMDRIEAFMKTAIAERRLAEVNMAAALLRRLYWLQIDEERPDISIEDSHDVVVYDLSATGSNYLKTLYALSVLTRKYYESLRRGPSDGLVEVIVVEEVQNYVRGRRAEEPPSIGERTVNELRAYGVGVVLVCPDPIQIPWHMARDVGALVAIGSQALPDFLERIRHSYSRRGPTTIGKTNSTFIFHRSKLKTIRFKPKPPKPLKLAAGKVPIGGRQLGRYSSKYIHGYGLLRADLRHRQSLPRHRLYP